MKINDSSCEKYPRLIFFDGVCNFCIAAVDFVIRRDPQKKFMFSTLQSELGQEILRNHNLNTQDFDTFLYLENQQVFTKSTAALKVSKALTGVWPLLYVGILIPQAIRDSVYQFIGRRRYRWMGKRDVCRVSNESDPARFV